MDWWGWVAWALSLVTGLGGLVLGIRAEARSRYRPNWTPDTAGSSLTFYNRTGEDASHVGVTLTEGWRVPNYRPYVRVALDESASFSMLPANRESLTPFGGVLNWTRTSSGKQYWLRFGDPEVSLAVMKKARADLKN